MLWETAPWRYWLLSKHRKVMEPPERAINALWGTMQTSYAFDPDWQVMTDTWRNGGGGINLARTVKGLRCPIVPSSSFRNSSWAQTLKAKGAAKDD